MSALENMLKPKDVFEEVEDEYVSENINYEFTDNREELESSVEDLEIESKEIKEDERTEGDSTEDSKDSDGI
jgi:Skp family chaperone for outer membrane proteins